MKGSFRIYIEGGSDGRTANAEFRRNWGIFLNELRQLARDNKYRSFDIVIGHGRSTTFSLFRKSATAHPGDLCVLLVDSETQYEGNKNVWDVVKQREGDGWDKPNWATEDHLYFMKVTNETWLLTDQDALKKFFGSDLKLSNLPTTELENREKEEIEKALISASKPCKKKNYRHGDAYLIIGLVRPECVKTLSHGQRFFEGVAALIQSP